MGRFGPRAARDVWWFFLILLVSDTVLVAYNIVRSSLNEAQVTHSLQVLNHINRLLSACVDTETGVRGFLVLGEDDLLMPYTAAKAEVPELISKLRDLTRDNAELQLLLAELDALIQQRLVLLQSAVAERRRPAPDQNVIKQQVLEGKRVMDQIREKIEAMRDNERQLLAQRQRSANSSWTLSIFTSIVGGVTSIGMLVLARWLMLRELEIRRKSDAAIRLSDERLGTLAETVPQIVWAARADGVYTFFNQRWFDYTGDTKETNPVDFYAAVHPDDVERVREHWHQCVKTGEELEIEYRLRRHDDQYRWFLTRARPIRNSSGHVTQWFGASTDIEDQRRAQELLEEQVEERTAELQRSNRELEQFAYVASHDLQEPLRKIQAFSDRLKTKFADAIEGQGKEYIDRMQNAAKRMRQLINDLLTYSRVTTRPNSFVPVNLATIATSVIDDLDESITQTNARVDLGPLPTISADSLQMRQLFQNLLSNALKFRKPEVPPQVTIRAEEVVPPSESDDDESPTPSVRLTFSDNGIGFDPVYSDRIFQVFQRLHGRDEYDGTGIGLAVVRKITERHGGTVTARGQPGVGATFEVVLPVNQKNPTDELSVADNESTKDILA